MMNKNLKAQVLTGSQLNLIVLWQALNTSCSFGQAACSTESSYGVINIFIEIYFLKIMFINDIFHSKNNF